MMAYDAHVMNRMSEEEILACLVAETGPKFKVRHTAALIYSTYTTVTCRVSQLISAAKPQ